MGENMISDKKMHLVNRWCRREVRIAELRFAVPGPYPTKTECVK